MRIVALLALLLPSVAAAADVVEVSRDGEALQTKVFGHTLPGAPKDGGQLRAFDSVTFGFGGFMQPRFVVVPQDESVGAEGTLGFSLRRARLETEILSKKKLGELAGTTIDLRLGTKFSIELTPEPSLRDAYFDLGFGPGINLRLGQFKAPKSRSLLTSDTRGVFPERAFWISELGERQVGAQLSGAFGKKHVEYAVAVFNGEGPNQPVNVNRKFEVVGRAVVSPLGGPGTGDEMLAQDAASWWKDPEKQLWWPTFSVGYAIHHNVLGPEGAQEATIGHDIEAFLHWRWITLQFEWLWKFTDFEDPAIPDYRTRGWYLQAMSFIPKVPVLEDHLAVLFRFEEGDTRIPTELDLPLTGATDSAQAQRRISFGVGVFVYKPLFKNVGDLRLTLTYSVRQEREGLSYDNDEFAIAAHVGF